MMQKGNAGATQLREWTGAFGQAYTKRNDLPLPEMESWQKLHVGKNYKEIYQQLLGARHYERILEVGCNVGKKLEIFRSVTSAQLWGVEPQERAVQIAHKRFPEMNIVVGTTYDLPFKDNFFDVVYTTEVLIHFSPHAIKTAMQEICRVSRRYIMGCEFWEKKTTSVIYRGKKQLLWKMDYPRVYQKYFPKLNIVKELVLPYKEQAFKKQGLSLGCFLLEKNA